MQSSRESVEEWLEIDREEVYSGHFLSVWRNQVMDPLQKVIIWEVVERSDSVVIIASLDDRIVMVRMLRYPTNQKSWEFPAGGIEDGEVPEAAALRELEEEVGVSAATLRRIGVFYPVPALTRQRCFVFHAILEEAVRVGAALRASSDQAEIESVFFTIPDILTMVSNGTITDGFTLAALSLFVTKQNA